MSQADTQNVKRRIKSVTSMERITNAMRLLSSAKLNKAKAQYEKTNANFNLIEHMIAEIFHDAQEDIPKDFLTGQREVKKVCYIVITSNKGLCGGFNSNVIRTVEDLLKEEEAEPVMITIGTLTNS